jgi:hypothetical protein
VSETEKKPDTQPTTPDPFIPVEQQKVTRYQEELRKHTQEQKKKFTVIVRSSIDSKLQYKAGIQEQKNVLKTLIPTVAIIFVLFLVTVQIFIPQHLMLAIFLFPAVTVSTLLASTKINRSTLKNVGKLREKLKRKPKIVAPTPPTATPTITPTPPTPTTPKTKRSLHLTEKFASENVLIILLPITTVACVILYLLQAPYCIFFWIILLGFCYIYVLKLWLRTRRIEIRISVKKRNERKRRTLSVKERKNIGAESKAESKAAT